MVQNKLVASPSSHPFKAGPASEVVDIGDGEALEIVPLLKGEIFDLAQLGDADVFPDSASFVHSAGRAGVGRGGHANPEEVGAVRFGEIVGKPVGILETDGACDYFAAVHYEGYLPGK